MKVLVTGGSGFLGSHVAEQLSKAGHQVVALVRKSSNRKFLQTLDNVQLAEGTVEDRASVDAAMKGVDAVVHSAGLVKARSEAELEAVNVKGTVNLLEAAIEFAPSLKRFVHISSLEACGPGYDGKAVPIDQQRPVTAYGRSKLAGEREVIARKDKVSSVILRPAAIFGPRDVELLEAFKAVSRRLSPVIGDGSMLGSFIYGPDCARACIAAIESSVPSGRIFCVDDGQPMTMMESMGVILPEVMGKKPFMKKGVPLGLMGAVARGVETFGKLTNRPVMLTREKVAMLSHHWICDSSSTRSELGWKPEISFAEGARLTAKWYQENGWL